MELPARRWAWTRSNEFGLFVAIIAVFLLTAALDSNHNYFRDPASSLRDIGRQTAFLGIFALGAATVIIAGGIDLSSGSMIAFSGTVCASLMVVMAPEAVKNSEPLGLGVIVVSVLGTLLVGFLIGSLHAWLITVVGLPPFIATLATLVGLRSLGRALCESVTLTFLGGKSTQINVVDENFRYLATSVWIPIVIFLVLAVLIGFLLRYTVVGRHIYALGGNEEAAKLSGIRTDRVKWLAYCIGTLTSSIAGMLYIGDQSVADPQTLGRGYELNAIASAVVGGCSLQGGFGGVTGTVLGALFLRTVIDGVAKVIKTGADVYEGLIVGTVVILAVTFARLRKSRGEAKQLFPGALGWVAGLALALLLGVIVSLVAGKLWGGGALLVAVAAVLAAKLVPTGQRVEG